MMEYWKNGIRALLQEIKTGHSKRASSDRTEGLSTGIV